MAKDWRRFLRFRCTCCGNCCREPIVIVTDRDVGRITQHTGQTAEQVVRFYKPSDIGWSTRKPGWIKFRSGKRIMGLRRNRRGCQYLGRDDLCTIYEHRPVTCHRYPFNVEFDEDDRIEGLSISQAVECPYELDGANTMQEIKVICDWEEKEETPYHEKVRAWNRDKTAREKRVFVENLGI